MGKSKPPQYVLSEINGDTDVQYDILIDSAEQSYEKSKYAVQVIEWLEANGWTYRKMKLPCFDYIINRGRGLAWERKSLEDFIASWLEKPEKDQEKDIRIVSQLKRMTNPEILSLEIPRCVIIHDGLQYRMFRETHFDVDMKQKTNWSLEYSSSIASFTTVDQLENEKIVTVRQDNNDHTWEKVRLHPNSLIGFFLATQRYMPLVLLGGLEHSIDFIRLQLEKAKKEESDANQLRKMLHTMGSASSSAEDWKIQHQILQTMVSGLGTARVHKLLLEKKTLKNIFTTLTPEDWICCTTRKDGEIDEATRKVAEEFDRILNVEYNPPIKDEKKEK